MKFNVVKTSDWGGDTMKIEKITTLKQLIEFMENSNHPIIISKKSDMDNGKPYDYELEIYDDWRE